jgi:hypothetical protein
MYRIHWHWIVINSALSMADLFITILSLIVISQCTPFFAIQIVSSLFIRQNYENALEHRRRARIFSRVHQ